MRPDLASLKKLVPVALKHPYRRLRSLVCRDGHVPPKPYVKEINLRRTLMGGEAIYDAGQWAEMTGHLPRASMLLKGSPHVQLLEQYRTIGEDLFVRKNFEQTPYFKNAMQSVQFWGGYFGQRTHEGILMQARAFVTIYEHLKNGDPSEVEFPSENDHTKPQSLPLVRETLTPHTYQIVDGHHRLAIAWVSGRKEIKTVVLPPPTPTPLQSLVLSAAQTQGRRELYQPIESPEFYGWGLVRRCNDRFAMMHKFLAAHGLLNHKRPSVADVACSYGWFVNEFSKNRCDAIGVERDPASLKIGRIAYGLRPDQLVQNDLQTFLDHCDRTFDVVLLLSVLHYYPLKRASGTPEDLLKKIDAVTGSCLFLDTGQSHEEWWRDSLPEWDEDFIIKFIKRNTSFTRVVPLGTDSDNVDPYRNNYARTLFACVRS